MDPDRFAEKLFASFAQWFPGVIVSSSEPQDQSADVAETEEDSCHV